jgi:hypothetical protein
LTTACWFIEASTVLVREIATNARRPNFRQRRIVAFTASWCYAKFTPATLHRGDFAAGTPKRLNGSLNLSRAMPDPLSPGAAAIVQTPSMAAS